MGIAEIIVAICLQAEPGACVLFKTRQPAPLTACAVVENDESMQVRPGFYLARFTCRWSQHGRP